MFKRRLENGVFLGYELTRGPHYFFFGSRFLTREMLSSIFPRYEFRLLKQVHGHTVIAAPAEPREADGQFSRVPGQALVVQTADCLPILLAGPQHVAALHAGWRGVAQNIVAAGRPFLRPEFAAIGPHIGASSFEIGADVKDQLTSSCARGEELLHPHAHGKFRFDLLTAARRQLATTFPSIEIAAIADDTFTHADFHSFRRDRAQAGRCFSFVVINP